jgi:hypothetical protein
MDNAPRSLSDFVSARPTHVGPRPWIETIPEWPTILEGWNSGYTQSQIRAWLVEECGYAPEVVTTSRVAHLSKKYSRFRSGS